MRKESGEKNGKKVRPIMEGKTGERKERKGATGEEGWRTTRKEEGA